MSYILSGNAPVCNEYTEWTQLWPEVYSESIRFGSAATVIHSNQSLPLSLITQSVWKLASSSFLVVLANDPNLRLFSCNTYYGVTKIDNSFRAVPMIMIESYAPTHFSYQS